MTSEQRTRRRYLGGLGAALTAGVAGCSSILGGQGPGATGNQTTTGNATPDDASGVGGNGTEPAGNTTEDATSPYTRVYRRTIGSVVLIRVSSGSSRGGQGSGFVYQDNYVVTNAHVVSDATEVQVRFTEGSGARRRSSARIRRATSPSSKSRIPPTTRRRSRWWRTSPPSEPKYSLSVTRTASKGLSPPASSAA